MYGVDMSWGQLVPPHPIRVRRIWGNGKRFCVTLGCSALNVYGLGGCETGVNGRGFDMFYIVYRMGVNCNVGVICVDSMRAAAYCGVGRVSACI